MTVVGRNPIIINYGPKYRNKRVARNIDNSEIVGLHRWSEVENYRERTTLGFVVEGTSTLQPAYPLRWGQVVLLGTLDHLATEETPVDGVSVIKNPVQGRRSLVCPKVWQPGCRL